jgi:hypothetical protein
MTRSRICSNMTLRMGSYRALTLSLGLYRERVEWLTTRSFGPLLLVRRRRHLGQLCPSRR